MNDDSMKNQRERDGEARLIQELRALMIDIGPTVLLAYMSRDISSVYNLSSSTVCR